MGKNEEAISTEAPQRQPVQPVSSQAQSFLSSTWVHLALTPISGIREPITLCESTVHSDSRSQSALSSRQRCIALVPEYLPPTGLGALAIHLLFDVHTVSDRDLYLPVRPHTPLRASTTIQCVPNHALSAGVPCFLYRHALMIF